MSATLRINFTLSNYTASLALDGESGTEVLNLAPVVIKTLQEMGASPTATAPASNENGNGAAEPETKICPLHHAPMKRRTGKGGDSWYSHKAVDPDTGQEYWCRGKAKAAR
jgi:hypothetical protein